MSTPARAFLFFLLKSDRGEINRVFFFLFLSNERTRSSGGGVSRGRRHLSYLSKFFFFPRRPLRLATPSVLFLPRATPLSLHLELDGGASDVFQSLLSLQYGVCACADSCTDIYTTPPRTRPGQRRNNCQKRNTRKKKKRLNCPTLLNPLTLRFRSCFLSVSATFLFWVPDGGESRNRSGSGPCTSRGPV